MSRTRGAADITRERARQIESEGFTPAHDADHHSASDLVQAGIAYALDAMGEARQATMAWPWDADGFKPRDARANLVRAGALIAAAIDRIDTDEKTRAVR